MISRNHSENSLDRNQKRVIIRKPQTEDIHKLMNHKKLLFDDPSNYLKLPNELNFNFIIGKKNKMKKIIPTRKLTKKPTKSFIRMLTKRATKMRSSNSFSFDIKRTFGSSKKISLNGNEEDKSTLRKKRAKEVSNIFSNYRKIIAKNEKNNRDNNIDYNSEVPSFMKLYIKNSLSKQEKALKCKEEYIYKIYF